MSKGNPELLLDCSFYCPLAPSQALSVEDMGFLFKIRIAQFISCETLEQPEIRTAAHLKWISAYVIS